MACFYYWASVASPTLGCSIEISYYVGMTVECQINCEGGITWPTRMLKVILGGSRLWHPCYRFRLRARAALAWTKKICSLRNEKLKANIASETEEQRKERLRIEDMTRK